MLAKLATSTLDAADAKALMMYPATMKDLAAAGQPQHLAFEIPYFRVDGTPSGFKRWRYLEDTRSPLEQRTDKKPLRYVQPGDTVSEVYLPPLADWKAVAEDTSVELVITEGELKAACCTKHGPPCIGLGGVYTFRSMKKGLPLLPVFREFKWNNRGVVVAYDSDAGTNPLVVQARNELCRVLLSLGALPRVATLPPAEGGGKQGLDDLALAEGFAAVEAVLAEAEPYAAAAALHELNAEVAYVVDPGLVVTLATGKTMRASDFTGHAYANRHYTETKTVFDKDGRATEKHTLRKAAQAWVEWPARMELARMAFRPGQPKITEDRCFNTWKGWGCEPRKGSVRPWARLLDHLFEGKPEERLWFERWCGFPLLHPGVKMYTASVLWGTKTGTGKSLVGVSLGRIYGDAYTLIGDKELQSDRNEWVVGKQFVLGDDVTGHDQRKYADRLKTMITQEMVRIDQKYVPSYTMPDVVNYLFTSNHPDAFFLEDDDRRNFVHEVTVGPMDRAFYREYLAWLKDGGASHLFHHLLGLDFGDFRAEDRAPETASRASMIADGLSDVGVWARRLRDEPDQVLRLGDAVMPGDLWSSAELVKLYDPEGRGRVSANGLSRELKRAGLSHVFGGMPVRTASGQARLFAVRNRDRWSGVTSSKALAEHYDATRGLPGRKKKF
jgi:Family of unknown function (DUF5906)/Domain of unknown function (DUF3854)